METKKRIIAREVNMEDIDDLFEIYSDKEAMKFRGSRPMESLDDARLFVQNVVLEEGTKLTSRLGIELVETGGLIGTIMKRVDGRKEGICEIGYSIGKKYWGRGLGTEIVGLIVDDLKHDERTKELHAWSHRDNLASLRILEKMGFERGAIEEDAYLFTRKNSRHYYELFL